MEFRGSWRLFSNFYLNKASTSPLIASKRSLKTGHPPTQSTLHTQTNFLADNLSSSTLHSRNENLPVFHGLEQFRGKVAISTQGAEYLYEDLYMRSWDLAKGLMGILGDDWTNQKICVLSETGLSHLIITWACWMTGNVVIPLPVHASPERMEFLIHDSGAAVVLTSKDQADTVNSITKSAGLKLIALDESWWHNPESAGTQESALPGYFVENTTLKMSTAMILYTAGRIGKPRGIILSHSNLSNQIHSVADLWGMSSDDSVLHCLPFHQMYSLMNSLYAPLSCGAKVVTLDSFDPGRVWSHLLGVNGCRPVSLFPGTPSMYQQLLGKGNEMWKDNKTTEYVKANCVKKIRLMASSSSSLTEQFNSEWKALTGHTILNNYVAPEAGTVLSNRIAGSANIPGPGCFGCGAPIHGVDIRLVQFRDHTKSSFDILLEDGAKGVTVDEDNEVEGQGILGELLVKGDNIAKRYWNDGEERDVFSYDGWIPTGDIVLYQAGCYTVKGRLNIKTIERNRELVNAMEIKKKLLSNPDIDDATVLGLGDTDAEQKIAALLVLNKNRKMDLEKILGWCNNNMSANTIPSVLKIVENIPRDRTGHVDKILLFNQFPNIQVLCFYDNKL
jgi:acyl-CoA synthetase (AMP-forming)/AMP-acid ligase II